MARIGCVAAGAVTLYHSEPQARPSARLSPRRSRWRRGLRERSVLESAPSSTGIGFRSGRRTVTLNQPNVVVPSAPADFQSDNQDHIGDGGTGTVEYLCSGGKMSRKAFNFGSCQDANSSPQTVHCTRPGLPFADIDSADLIRCQAGRTSNVGYFHGSNAIDFVGRCIEANQCDAKKAAWQFLRRSCTSVVLPALGAQDQDVGCIAASRQFRFRESRAPAARAAAPAVRAWWRHLPTDDE